MDYESFLQTLDYERLDLAPEVKWTDELLQTCKRRWSRLRDGKDDFSCENWVFLQYLVDHQNVLLHGSQNPGIAAFEPRVAGNQFKDGQRPLVYASSSCMLSYWYAIVDREKLKRICGAVKFGMAFAPVHPQTMVKGHRHFFHFSHEAFPHRPFRPGLIYILPRETFTPEYVELQWYSEKPVIPLAAVPVDPGQWPMLRCVRAMNWGVKRSDPEGKFPQLDDTEKFPDMGVMSWP